MKKKLFYSLALFLFSSAFFVANSTTSKVADVAIINSDGQDVQLEEFKEMAREVGASEKTIEYIEER